jgi:hypothetical protein
MKRQLLIFQIAAGALIVYLIWSFWTFNVESSQKKIIPYDSLPSLVADMFRHSNKYDDSTSLLASPLLIIDSTNQNHYKFKTVTTGPWIDYYLIVKNRWIKYEVPYGKAFPFIIYHDQLYIPDHYNVANSESAESASYEKYVLTW